VVFFFGSEILLGTWTHCPSLPDMLRVVSGCSQSICCPYGGKNACLIAISAALGAIGSAFSIGTSFACFKFFKFSSDSDGQYCIDHLIASPTTPSSVASFVVAVVTFILGLIAFICTTVLSCHQFSPRILKMLGWGYFLLGILSLVFLVIMLVSTRHVEGQWASGAYMSLVNIFLFAGAGGLLLFISEHGPPDDNAVNRIYNASGL